MKIIERHVHVCESLVHSYKGQAISYRNNYMIDHTDRHPLGYWSSYYIYSNAAYETPVSANIPTIICCTVCPTYLSITLCEIIGRESSRTRVVGRFLYLKIRSVIVVPRIRSGLSRSVDRWTKNNSNRPVSQANKLLS